MQNLNLSVPKKIVLIGASTGGPGQIQKIITSLPVLTDTTLVIAQHMAKGFIPSFVKRLNEHSLNSIEIASDTQILESSHVYLCCGDTSIKQDGQSLRFTHKHAQENTFNPDINMIFNSFVPYAKNTNILSIILTGIGDDGVDGCKNLSINGATCLTENEKSAVVDGMTSRARENVPNVIVLDIDQIVSRIKEFCS